MGIYQSNYEVSAIAVAGSGCISVGGVSKEKTGRLREEKSEGKMGM